MRARMITALLLAGICSLESCSSNNQPVDESFSRAEFPVINGTKVTGNDYYSTVLIISESNKYCTGTLIHPEWVLTAAHCLHACDDDSETKAPPKYVIFGQSVYDYNGIYTIDKFYYHPEHHCNVNYRTNDIALIKLSEPVPLSLAVPVLPLPPSLSITVDEVKDIVSVTDVGFGLTNPNDSSSLGTKYKTSMDIQYLCGKSISSDAFCSQYEFIDGFMFFDNSKTGICSGDSGGPVFIEKNNRTYVAGINAFSSSADCNGTGAATIVTDYYDFIKQYAPVAAQTPEDCTNGEDDNGDNLVDCADPYCYTSLKSCIPENCTNEIDDNDNGLVDCKDPDCADFVNCKTEICNNGEDDNGDEFVDCEDPECFFTNACKPEICNNGNDDNENGLIDCQDPDCKDSLFCIPENCTNGEDDNGNGLIDCADPDCYFSSKSCMLENCTNGEDDNDNGLIDCADPDCSQAIECKPENCTNHIDDNGDNLVDCKDPQCQNDSACKKENCTNHIDDNGDDLVDCDDPQCAFEAACNAEDCSNGRDDDGNHLVDCDDPACFLFKACQPEDCKNGVDDNDNGLIDCADPWCVDAIVCQYEDCTNDIDDNGNGLIDCDDPLCSYERICKYEICDNGIDDDDNKLIDCDDPECKNVPECHHSVVPVDPVIREPECTGICGHEICNNGIDDNGDGLIDCKDPQCDLMCDSSGSFMCAMNNRQSHFGWPIFILIAAAGAGLSRKRNA